MSQFRICAIVEDKTGSSGGDLVVWEAGHYIFWKGQVRDLCRHARRKLKG